MAIYSVGRKRVMLALLLTSVLLVTIDLRGNSVVDGLRSGFAWVMEPVQSATTVVTNPIERAWNGIVNYDELERENQALQDQVDRMIGTQAAAEAAVLESQELRALYSLPSLSGIDTVVAQVVGRSANNLDQVIEINQGRKAGIEIGMAVVNQAGLVGKVTSLTDYTARVMLVTDARYTVAVNVTAAPEQDAPAVTAPSGLSPEEVAQAGTTTTTAPPTPTLPNGLPATGTTLPNGGAGALRDPVTGEPLTEEQLAILAQMVADELAGQPAVGGVDPGDSVPSDSAPPPSTATTTTIPATVEKEYGALEGRGRRLLPQIRFVQDSPSLAVLRVGDLVETAGDSTSLAPTGIPVGVVVNRANRPGSAGPLLDVELYADLYRLNYVRVVLYKPLSEVRD